MYDNILFLAVDRLSVTFLRHITVCILKKVILCRTEIVGSSCTNENERLFVVCNLGNNMHALGGLLSALDHLRINVSTNFFSCMIIEYILYY
jgi:hypothetical protein